MVPAGQAAACGIIKVAIGPDMVKADDIRSVTIIILF